VHRADRLGQVDDAGGDGQPPERERVRPSWSAKCATWRRSAWR
jgi:hypothetical protein